jgi:3-deoxy-7-phosphoheptulonate synthase
MLVIMKKTASEEDLEQVKQFLVERDFDFHQSTGADRKIIGIVGKTYSLNCQFLKKLPGVLDVYRIPSEDD